MFELAESEAARCWRRWRAARALDRRISELAPLESPQGQRVVQGLTYVFTLLLTVLDPQPAGLAIRALAQRSPSQRGTGLEYLQNVLPAKLWLPLNPLLEDPRLALGQVRARNEILAELTAARSRDRYDLVQLRRLLERRRRGDG